MRSRRGSSVASTIKAWALLNSSSGVNSPPVTIDNTSASCSRVVMSSIGLLGRHFWGPDHHNLHPVQGGSVLVGGNFNGLSLRIDVLGKFRVHSAEKLKASIWVGRYADHGLDRIVAQGLQQLSDFSC